MIRTAREIAEFTGAKLEGDANLEISGVASPESAGTQDLIYVSSARNLQRAAESRARCVLLPPGVQLEDRTVLRVEQPKLAFAKVAGWLRPEPAIATGVHKTAVIAPTVKVGDGVGVGPHSVIEDDVELGDGAQIGAQCFIGRGARIGEGCRMYPRVTLYAGVRLGKNVIVHSGAVIGSDGFGYVLGDGRHWKFPQIGAVEIGDDVEIGSNTTIDRGALDTTRIGAGTKIDNLVQVAHNVQIGEHCIIAAQTGISGSSNIGDRVSIGGQVGIADGCHIRDGAVVGAQAGIPTGKTIPAGATVWGTPARPLVKFKEQFAWFSRLPELGERLKKLEQRIAGG
jgi:UDP-3-O-[3-hydroxymyristoyl] glucosamine N-acyltransferase